MRGRHWAQMYGSDVRLLASTTAPFLAEALEQGGSVLVVATKEHWPDFRSALACEEYAAEGRVIHLDARDTLSQFMIDGMPDWQAFNRTVGAVVRNLRAKTSPKPLRAFGEMVGVLWEDGYFSAAVTLEEFWNKLLGGLSFELCCGYPIDVLGHGFHACDVEAIQCTHTSLVSCDPDGLVERAVRQALGELSAHSAPKLQTESLILWVKENVPESAAVIRRSRQLCAG
jgi:hypothetical protein